MCGILYHGLRPFKVGATATVNINDGDPVAAIKKLTTGKGVNFAFQCTGSTKIMELKLPSSCVRL